MKTPFLILAAVFIGAGVFNNVSSLTKGERQTEAWLEALVPTQVADYKLQPSEPGAKTTYRMDKATYEELDPVGITAQRMDAPDGKQFEAVVVAGDSMKSFHDQRWCFAAQGWTILEESYATANTKSYGEIPVSIVKIGRGGGAATWSVFTFKGPTKFHSNVFSMSKDYFFHELLKQSKYVGYEFRFIPGFSSATKEDVVKFAAQYIDTAHETSKGIM